jgi:hypothetical protein
MKKSLIHLGLLVVCLGLFLSLSATPTRAQQASSGSVSGTVTDQQSSAVPGAEVTLLDTATSGTQTTVTNDSGRYTFPVVHPGIYDITITKAGFKVHKAAGQRVSVGLVLNLNVTLEVGSVAETVVVTATAGNELQTTNAGIGNTISGDQLHLLPNLGRDATTLLALQPGVNPNGGAVAGAYMDQSTFTVDGGNNTDDMAGNTIGYIVNFTGTAGGQTNGIASGVVPTPIESIEEFKTTTFGQTADFNSSSGANVQMVTKRGTNQWHGSGYGYFYAPNILGANSWANNHTAFNKGIVPASRPACSAGTTFQTGDNNCVMPYTPLIPNHRDRFGFTVGGAMMPKKILGGKTYVFMNYEGFRYPNSGLFERNYPTAALRAGVIQVQNVSSGSVTANGTTYPSGAWVPYNLNPLPVTVQIGNPTSTTSPLRTVTLPGATTTCGASGGCDLRGIGLNPIVNQIWQSFLPIPNDPLSGDQFNTQGYLSTLRAPLTSDVYIGRIDHDFGPKHRFFTSYRGQKLINTTTNQVDVGGLLNGGTVGTYKSSAPRPQTPELWVIGLTSNVTASTTNDLRLSYLWNWWEWKTSGGPPQLPGLGGAIEIAPGNSANGESTGALIPYNVNSQSVRQRVWDGQDKMIRDDVSMVKGNHLVTFGGMFQRNFDFHVRSDNGQGVNNNITYQIARQGIDWSSSTYFPTAINTGTSGNISTQQTAYSRLASEVLGMVGLPQVAYARVGSDLHLLPVGSSAFDKSIIKTYNVYFSDTWHMKPSLTINYGLGYIYETPPVELEGKQVALVYQDKTLVDTADYLAKRKAAALAGQVYNPIIGFATTGSLGLKYPYTPFKKGLSPRISVAWNPNYKSGLLGKLFGDGKTVLRGGYGRIYGRLNGVNLVLVPLLGVGLLQSVSCANSNKDGTCSSSPVNPTNVFRIGTDGLVAPLPAASATLPQPFFTGGTNPIAQDATMLDPAYKPEKTDNIDFTVQRQFGSKMSLEVGYMGRRIKNVFQEVNLDAVPYMTTLGGQTFAQAYANVYTALNAGTAFSAISSQPFFEAALGGPGSTYCTGFANCTQALVGQSSVRSLINSALVSQFWGYLGTKGTLRSCPSGSPAGCIPGTLGSWVLPRSMISESLNGGAGQSTTLNMTTALGFSNYNALFVTMRMRDWHGVSGVGNFTWGRSLGTAELAQYNSSNTVLDPWNIGANYGPQNFDIQALFNAGISYQPTSLLGVFNFRNAKGIVGHLVKGWSISPFFTYQSGPGNAVVYSSGGQAFGEVTPPGGDGSTAENAVMSAPFTGGTSVHYGVPGSNGVGTSNPGQLNMFADPASVIKGWRRCILGVDSSCGGYYNLRNPRIWNMDLTLGKDFKVKERVSIRASLQFTNVFNHFNPGGAALNIDSPSTFGRITGQAITARQTEFGLRIAF